MKRKILCVLSVSLVSYIGFSVNTNETPINENTHSGVEQDSLKNHYKQISPLYIDNEFMGELDDSDMISNTDYSGKVFNEFDGNFDGKFLKDVCFDGCDLRKASFKNTRFKRVSFNDAIFNSDFRFGGSFKENTIIKGLGLIIWTEDDFNNMALLTNPYDMLKFFIE